MLQSHVKNISFADYIKNSHKGKLKIYIGMIAGVGKTYRLLQEAKSLVSSGIDVQIAFIETHGRAETQALLEGLPIIPRKKIFYKGKEVEEMDLQAILNMLPQLVIVDELAHSNTEGSKNEKRWQDVLDLLEAGINVITAFNVQHLDHIQEKVKMFSGIDVREVIPREIFKRAYEIVNIDLTADELINRLKEGKIYAKDKINSALDNFFQKENILQLRELALKEVAVQLGNKIEEEVFKPIQLRQECYLACISSNNKKAHNVIAKTSMLAKNSLSKWYVLYVQTRKESPNNIPLDKQRYLINNFKTAIDLGAEIITIESEDILTSIIDQSLKMNATTICLGKPRFTIWKVFIYFYSITKILRKLKNNKINLIILSE